MSLASEEKLLKLAKAWSFTQGAGRSPALPGPLARSPRLAAGHRAWNHTQHIPPDSSTAVPTLRIQAMAVRVTWPSKGHHGPSSP